MNSAADLMAAARTIGALLVVLAIAYGLARLARRSTSASTGRGLRVVDRLALTRDASLAVVQVAGRGLVLGITSQSVSVLSEIEPALLVQHYRTAARPVTAQPLREPTVDGAGTRPTPKRKGNGSVLDPATWGQAVNAMRDLTVRRS
jgi:flagellar biosynthetic protein FliO